MDFLVLTEAPKNAASRRDRLIRRQRNGKPLPTMLTAPKDSRYDASKSAISELSSQLAIAPGVPIGQRAESRIFATIPRGRVLLF
jgi:hypothetical protein